MQPPVVEALHLNEHALAAQEFARISRRIGLIRERTIRREEALDNFGKPGRDVREANGVISNFISQSGWLPHMRMASLQSDWASIVGKVLADHSHVAQLANGILTVRSDSPAWTTELEFLRPTILEKVRERLQGLEVKDLRITGPHAHGPGMRNRIYVEHNKRPPRPRSPYAYS